MERKSIKDSEQWNAEVTRTTSRFTKKQMERSDLCILKKGYLRWGAMPHACNPSDSRDKGRRIVV